MRRIAVNCASLAPILAICSPAISEAMREKPVKTSIIEDTSSRRRPGEMIMGRTPKVPSRSKSIRFNPP